MIFNLPFAKGTLPLEVSDETLCGVLSSSIADYVPKGSPEAIVRESIQNPIASPPLRKLARGKKKITLIASDHTRPVPSRIIIPEMLSEIRRGNPEADITILVATGLHRTTTKDELEAKFGPEITAKEKIIVHDCDDAANMVDMGLLPSGGRLLLNRLAVEADLLVSEGFIEPHFFAGFSGGRKSVLPGVASRETVMYNHNSRFISDSNARTGLLEGNPIHRDMLFAARAAKLAFIVNVVIDASHNPVFCVSGDCDEAHKAGCRFLSEKCSVDAIPADIVVSTNGGNPLDQNVYQSVKGMTAAEATVNDGGIIVMLSSSIDGHGGENFYKTFRDSPDMEGLMASFLARKPEDTIVDQWQSQIFARVLQKATVIFVSSCEDGLIRDMHMIPAHTAQEALSLAFELKGKGSRVTVIPDGVSIIVKQ